MKGLLIKDFAYIKASKIWPVMLVMTLLFAFQNISFLASYMAIISITLVQTTFTYDEFEDGMSYLLTLPITRKLYVKSKYMTGLILLVGLLVFVLVIGVGVQVVRGGFNPGDWAGVLIGSFFVAGLFLSTSIPTIIKFGVEKGRMAGFAVMGIVALLIVGAAKTGLFSAIDRLEVLPAVFGSAACAALMLFISYRLSLTLISKKEY